MTAPVEHLVCLKVWEFILLPIISYLIGYSHGRRRAVKLVRQYIKQLVSEYRNMP